MWKYILMTIIAILFIPDLAYAGVLSDTFSKGGAGYAVVQIMVLAAAGYLFSFVVSALGHHQLSNMIKVVTVFSCFSIGLSVVISAIVSVAQTFGVTL